ncbi:MAG: HAMP domain-containing protein, partial [Opitutaceae bacterium]|nr:HAMP domain-containing protein [Opitutaceae bacterium]
MKTIGSRLTTLYVVAVAGMLAGVLLLGRYLLENHLVGSLDATLQLHFNQLKDRLNTDTGSDEMQGLLAATGITSDLSVQVRDLWDDPAYRDARSRGEPAPMSERLQFFTVTLPDETRFRAVEGVSESLSIRLALPLAQVSQALGAYTQVGGGIALVVLILSIAAGHVLSRVALRPVQLIERTAARISSDNLSERIPVQAVRDEISNLAHLLNETFARLESAVDQIKRFSADASHELKTPLSLVRLNLERVILKNELSPLDREALQDATEEIHRMDRLIESLLFLSRAEAGEVVLKRETVDVP